MNRIGAIIVIFLSICSGATPPERVAAGKMLGKTLFYDMNGISYDTLGWENICQNEAGIFDSMIAKGPAGGCSLFRAKGKSFFRLKECTAISAAILKDLKYPVLALTRWSSVTNLDIKVMAPGLDKEYQKQHLITDYLWERVDSFDIQKPESPTLDYRLRLCFIEGACSEYDGKEILERTNKQFVGTLDGLVVRITPGERSTGEEQNVKRTILDLYIITEVGKKPASIIAEIEKAMDKIKLDMSYKPPQIIPVGCK